MNLLSEFLTTYDELSVFNDIDIADTADSQWLSRAELDSTLVTKANEWQSAVASRFRGQIVFQGIIQFFASQNQQETTIEPLARQCKGALARWHSNAVKASLSSFNERTDNPDYKINLYGSWYGYCFGLDFSVKDSQQKQQLVIDCVETSARYFEVDESDILLYTAKVQQSSMYIICVKHDNSANKSTLDRAPMSFNLTRKYIEYSTLTPLTSTDIDTSSDTSKVSIEDLFDKAVDFTIDFVNTGYRAVSGLSELTKESIKTEDDLLDVAFYVEDLITYYHLGNENQRNNMLALLNIFKVKLCGTGDDDDYESVQYLGSSGRQERILAEDLGRNTAATKTPYESDEEERYHYLVSKKFVTGKPDFKYNKSKIDAKIYRDESQMRKLMTKKAHGADFLIVYLKYPKEDVRWRALATHEIEDFATAKKLQSLITKLNKQESIPLVERTDF